jgi:phenylpyruvate tautomerase PptA (4-oxalocrotonate tautomerase family)
MKVIHFVEGDKMPLVKIEIIKGKTMEYKKALLDGVHSALVKTLKIPNDDRIQRLYELDADSFEYASTKTDKMTLIELTIFNGRSLEAKRHLYYEIVNNLAQSPGISGNDIIIVIHEPPLENWGIHGGKPANEVNLSYEINV